MRDIEFWLDYLDPGSWVMYRRLRIATATGGALSDRVVRIHGREVRTPSMVPLDPASAAWRQYVESICAVADGEMSEYRTPATLPHTRKAHELALHAEARDCRAAVDSAMFRVALVEGRDVGRVDVLVELAVDAGLDRSETRAVLDVDRYTDEVVRLREAAASQGVVGVPTMVHAGRLLEGVRTMDEIRAWLGAPPDSSADTDD
jgi:predicted DsbA family dithiol-disulfide isomerase